MTKYHTLSFQKSGSSRKCSGSKLEPYKVYLDYTNILSGAHEFPYSVRLHILKESYYLYFVKWINDPNLNIQPYDLGI